MLSSLLTPHRIFIKVYVALVAFIWIFKTEPRD